MKTIEIDELPKVVLPMHQRHYSQELRGPNTGNDSLSVMVCAMEAEGGAEMHSHDVQEHIFYVLEGEMQVNDGVQDHIVKAGQGIVIPPGEPHKVTGTYRGIDARYLVVTMPPAWTK